MEKGASFKYSYYKLYANERFILSSLFEAFLKNLIHLETGIKSDEKNRLMSWRNRISLRKSPVMETVNDELENICQIDYSGRRNTGISLMNRIPALVSHNFFTDRKRSFKFERKVPEEQQYRFY
ncbi:MAG: transposase [Tannerellaceae bacterium]|nr:transposase [Tannerellaceae bacterium]